MPYICCALCKISKWLGGMEVSYKLQEMLWEEMSFGDIIDTVAASRLIN